MEGECHDQSECDRKPSATRPLNSPGHYGGIIPRTTHRIRDDDPIAYRRLRFYIYYPASPAGWGAGQECAFLEQRKVDGELRKATCDGRWDLEEGGKPG